MNQHKVAQIYVQSSNRDESENQEESHTTDENYNSLREQFSLSKEIEQSMEEAKSEATTEAETDVTYDSIAHYYREQLCKDITSCSKVPSVFIEIIAALISIANIIVAFIAFHEISFITTNLKYTEYAKDDGAMYHGENLKLLSEDSTVKNLNIYKEPVFINWRNFVYLGLSLIAIEFLAPLLRVVIEINRAPKKINTLHTLVQISLLTALVLEDGAVSLCKNMLFAEECQIRGPMMSTISQVSASLCFVNATFKSILFIWRSSYRSQRAVRDEMEAYTEILILEEYQWFHCIIPILAHIAVIGVSIWSLVDATSPMLRCVPNS